MKKVIGIVLVITLAACNSNPKKTESKTGVPIPLISYTVVKEYPHDIKAYTEGLQYIDGKLYESTGEYGQSDLRVTDLNTGKVLQQTKLGNQYFGEGLTVLNGKIYQLTYKEHVGFVYDKVSLKLEKAFPFSSPEGWGMTSDGKYLIYDNGGSELHFMDPNMLIDVKQLTVTDENGAVERINELEYIKGFIYANQWQTDNIYKIDPETGKVVGLIDMSELRAKTGIPPLNDNDRYAPEVLNGIAYDAVNDRIFVTGKYWPKILEIKLGS